MIENQISISSLTYFGRNPNESIKESFSFFKKQKADYCEKDLNYFKLFSTTGKDLSHLSLMNLPLKGKSKFASLTRLGDCHNFCREILFNFKQADAINDSKLYYGFVDIFESDVYTGTFQHSFLTYCIDGIECLVDPSLITHSIKSPKTSFRNHFGIPLPFDYLVSLKTRNFSAEIKENVILSKAKTISFIKMIKQNL